MAVEKAKKVMNRDSEFVEYEGKIHLINPASGGEHTLCGDAFDAHQSENAPEREFKPTKHRTITCWMCGQAVLACRGVKVKLPAQ